MLDVNTKKGNKMCTAPFKIIFLEFADLSECEVATKRWKIMKTIFGYKICKIQNAQIWYQSYES